MITASGRISETTVPAQATFRLLPDLVKSHSPRDCEGYTALLTPGRSLSRSSWQRGVICVQMMLAPLHLRAEIAATWGCPYWLLVPTDITASLHRTPSEYSHRISFSMRILYSAGDSPRRCSPATFPPWCGTFSTSVTIGAPRRLRTLCQSAIDESPGNTIFREPQNKTSTALVSFGRAVICASRLSWNVGKKSSSDKSRSGSENKMRGASSRSNRIGSEESRPSFSARFTTLYNLIHSTGLS